jgi:hypothetical protein
MGDLINPTMGQLVTPLIWDGDSFRVLLAEVTGALFVKDAELKVICQYNQRGRIYSTWFKTNSGSAGSGTISFALTAIPTGYWGVVTHYIAYLTAGSTTGLYLQAKLSGIGTTIAVSVPTGILVPLISYNDLILGPNDNLQVTATGVGPGTIVVAYATGYLSQWG